MRRCASVAGAATQRYDHFALRSSFILPCNPTLRDRLPKGEGWLYEVKFDGYRMQVHNSGERVILFTGNGADWTGSFPRLAICLAALHVGHY
jgi:bifunctional non-homologous end joining protein LigD